jgi:serine/threonine protein kinase
LDGLVSALMIRRILSVEHLNVSFSKIDISPEMANGEYYDFSVDIWSFGIMIYEMVTGFSPFSAEKTDDVILKVREYKDFSSVDGRLKDANISVSLIDLVSKLIAPDIRNRLTIDNFFKHDWVTENLKTV